MLLHALAPHYISTADTALARVDTSSLSDQTMMELFVSEMTDESQREFKDADGNFLDVCSWIGVDCDDECNVTEVNFSNERLQGHVLTQFTPRKTLELNLYNGVAKKTGTLDAASLSETLIRLCIERQDFSGEVDFSSLPRAMVSLEIAESNFSGQANLDDLPPRMELFEIQGHRFHGKIHFAKLPRTLQVIDNSRNALSGALAPEDLPEALTKLCASECKLEGTVDFSMFPQNIEKIFLNRNKFWGSA